MPQALREELANAYTEIAYWQRHLSDAGPAAQRVILALADVHRKTLRSMACNRADRLLTQAEAQVLRADHRATQAEQAARATSQVLQQALQQAATGGDQRARLTMVKATLGDTLSGDKEEGDG